jgi:hypothetical protein
VDLVRVIIQGKFERISGGKLSRNRLLRHVSSTSLGEEFFYHRCRESVSAGEYRYLCMMDRII